MDAVATRTSVNIDYASILRQLIAASEGVISANDGSLKANRSPSSLLAFYKTIRLQGATNTGMMESVYEVATKNSLILVSDKTSRARLIRQWGGVGLDIERHASRVFALDSFQGSKAIETLKSLDYVFVLDSNYFWSRHWLNSHLPDVAPELKALLILNS